VFTHVTTYMLTEPLERLFTSKAPTTSLPRPPLRLLPGGTNQFPGGTNPAEKHRLSRRTCRVSLELRRTRSVFPLLDGDMWHTLRTTFPNPLGWLNP
jgi:hypothetical protein